MTPRDRAGNGEAQAITACFPTARIVETAEGLEYGFELVWRNTRSIVKDNNFNFGW